MNFCGVLCHVPFYVQRASQSAVFGHDTAKEATDHELRQVDLKALLCIVVCKDPIIWQRPSKCICDDDYNAFGGTGCVCDVAIKTVSLFDAPCGNARVERSGSTARLERHFLMNEWCRKIRWSWKLS